MPLARTDHQPLSVSVADAIRTAIDRGELLPGERLVERELAAQLGVSHIPVREALARLEDEGVVTRELRRGARVAELNEDDLDEIASVRIVLEQLAVERAIARWTPEATAALEEVVAEMERCAAAGDADGLVEADRRFHDEIWRLADHKLLLELARDTRLRVNRFLRAATLSLTPAGLVAKAEEHRRLALRMSEGDVGKAKDEMRRHIETAGAQIELAREDRDLQPASG